ncbi:transmembrane protein 94-like isoform X2 [Dendronephthya gigantea]|nr:transmembrane protein 94-like isoform X2 [Dendronephthya gigantea]
MVELSIIVAITALNIVLGVREERLRKTELSKKIAKFLTQCQAYRLSCPWSDASYPHLATPSTDSLSLVWTYRKNRLVNVPANLLVEGDVIVLGPGQKCPAKVQLKSPNGERIFDAGEIYRPENEEQQAAEHLENERLFSCQPCPRQKFTVVEAPLEGKLRTTFYSSQRRPTSLLDNERCYVIKQVLQFRVIPVILGLSFLINLIRFLLSRDDFGSWSEMIFILQAYVIIPLLPLLFPLMWIVINCFGTARIQVLFKSEISQLSKKVSLLPLSDVNYHFWKIFKGESDTLSRTANLLHTLGTISVLCCVNKDGILASPNPNAEKVFFFRKRKERRNKRLMVKDTHFGSNDDRAVFFTAHIDDDEESSTSPTVRTDVHFRAIQGEEESENSAMPTPLLHHKDCNFVSHSEVLNLSCDPKSEFGVIFDDIRWRKHLSSLKPLGLNILLNAPCSSPVNAVKLTDHLGHLSLLVNDTPVRIVRRCLCLLGRQIGFIDSALENFRRKHNIFAFKASQQLNDSAVPSNSFLSVCKETPVPFLTSLVVEHVTSGHHQLLSQGSADLLLDVCTDFWDGSEVHPLTSMERRKIQDFFHRTSITSNCIALSYRPITQSWHGLDQDVFLEIPDGVNLLNNDSDNGSMSSSRSEGSEEDHNKVGETSLGLNSNEIDLDFYQRIIGGQIFIGMITLQHKAKQDIPPLVEDLNNAGIRFVYFSEENEIKSQVFAERLGLETGWNCHISFSEKTFGFDEHSTLTAGSEGKVDDTADDFLVTHVTPVPDDAAAGDMPKEDDVTCPRDEVTGPSPEEGDVTGDVFEEDDVDIDANGEETEVEKKVKWQGSEARDRKSSGASSSSMSTNNDDVDHGGDIRVQISNRAKLPRGIINIRPHLEDVDNVPLLVPLFTDCTPQAAREMISIMQEYGEVVCCIGSSLNIDNLETFNQADVSVALQPSFPQVCLNAKPRHRGSQTSTPEDSSQTNLLKTENRSHEEELNPLTVSSKLNGISCSLSFHRDYNIKFVALLKEARRLCFGLRICFTFMLSCQLTLCLVMLTASVLLPPPLTGLHLLWFTCVLVPALSISLVNADNDLQLMTTMTAKNDNNFKGYNSLFFRFHGLAFLPIVFISNLLIFPLILLSFCERFNSSTEDKCHYFLGNRNISETWNGFGHRHLSCLALAQDVVAFFLMLCFVFMSTSYVHHLHPLWKKLPFFNKQWIVTVLVLFILQVFYMTISQLLWQTNDSNDYDISHIPQVVFCLVFIWPIFQLGLCEFSKCKYIKFYIRYQKRAKLKFGTKLGMNSPF